MGSKSKALCCVLTLVAMCGLLPCTALSCYIQWQGDYEGTMPTAETSRTHQAAKELFGWFTGMNCIDVGYGCENSCCPNGCFPLFVPCIYVYTSGTYGNWGCHPFYGCGGASGTWDVVCDDSNLPDTGQYSCYDASDNITCPQPGEPFYGQDAQYGPNLQSFTKLDDNGTALPDNATAWAMVRDNVSGLEWQAATAPGTYTWQQAIDYCAGLSLGGHDDWRLPTIKELAMLVDSSIPYPGPTINMSYFPSTVASLYWSSTTNAYSPSFAWIINFYYGYFDGFNKDFKFLVRAVRAGQSGLFENSFIDNGDGTVTDTGTGLMWQQATAPGTYTWGQSLAYCESLTLGGHSDWRLPNRNELQSLVDYSQASLGPTINTTYFPDTQASGYWSSTTYAYHPYDAWIVYFLDGYVYYFFKSDSYYVRAVRAGQCGSLGDSDGDTVCDDIDNCPNDYNPAQVDCDNDVIGDACDNDTIDPDADGVDQGCDICWTKTNPTQLDTNGNCPAPPYISDPKCGDACNVCMADIDNSGRVNTTDLGIMKTEFFRTNCATVPCRADINNDNKVNTTDLGIMKTEFFRTNCFQY